MRLLIARTNSTRTSTQHVVPPEKLIKKEKKHQKQSIMWQRIPKGGKIID